MITSLGYTFTDESGGERICENQSIFGKVMSKSRAFCFFYLRSTRGVFLNTVQTYQELNDEDHVEHTQ